MSYFILGKTSDNCLYLVSEMTFETRADALRELGRITASSRFDGWDDEIVVLDDSQGAPVLLVRPASELPVDDTRAPEPADTELEPEPAEPEPEQAEPEPAEDEQAEPEPAEDEPAEAQEAAEETEAATLRDAIARSTAQMESEGISAPESVGASPAEPAFGDVPASWPWDSEGSLSGLEEPGDDDGSLVRAAGDDETFAASRPVILGAYEDASTATEESAAEPASDPEETPEAADVQSEPQPEREPEPAPEPEPEPEPEPAPETEPEPEPEPAPEPEPEPEPESAPETEQEPAPEPEPEPDVSAPGEFVISPEDPVADSTGEAPDLSSLPIVDVTSDFVILDPIESEANDSPRLEEMTCRDCVYVETCPNKDQRIPASCGSFQWK